MSQRKRLTSKDFHAINRALKAGFNVEDVATSLNWSDETVRTVKRSKTWPRFEAAKKLKNEQRRPTYLMESAKPLLLPLVSHEEQLNKVVQAPENQIRPEIKVVTVQEWEGMNRKVGALYSMIKPSRGLARFWGRK
jgi:IS30 family transposase